jgi:ABC-type enterochelin transport system substrate-binding protein
MSSFKGRVTEINGTKITIDVKPETREYIDEFTKEVKTLASAFPDPEMPKIGAVIRANFHNKDKQ